MNNFKTLITNWFEKNGRSLPWRGTQNPYDILLSEFILQQTRIEQGTPYFFRIKKQFPTLKNLAFASEEDVLCCWQGLGYYTRARNLHHSAQVICDQFNGEIPSDFDTLRKLKGIGDYTAAAIASIGFNKPVPLIDGNVMRVVSRIFAIQTPIDTTQGKKEIYAALEKIFDANNVGTFNEAMMDFGAMQCVPLHPNCNICPMTKLCKAFQTNQVNQLPVKQKQKPVKIRNLNYLVVATTEKQPQIVLQKRTQNDIWKNLYEFPLIETDSEIADEILLSPEFWQSLQSCFSHPNFRKVVRKAHKLTHRLLQITFTVMFCEKEYLKITPPYLLLYYNEIQQKPLPIVLANFLNEWRQENSDMPDNKTTNN